MRCFIYLLLICEYLLLINAQELLVTIDQGNVIGHKHETREVYEFYGIPYATIPTGRDKFKAPLPAQNWGGTLDAVERLVVCPQNFLGLSYQEDCLVANIFVPENRDSLKPVVAYIHGGAFYAGYGSMGDPHHLVARDIVVVNFNYRLGAHGFLCLNTENIPGNAGLRDQLAALRWIKANIEAFGGNSNDITLAGYSAGSTSAELLMLSPAANNLFNKVILESGSAISTWAVNPRAFEHAQLIASENGATDVENVDMLEEYYLKLSFEDLVDLSVNDWTGFSFSPCIDKNSTFEEVVIEALPYDILASGNYTKLPLLTGFTDAEGLIWYEARQEIMAVMNENFSIILPPYFDSYSKINRTDALELIEQFYFNDEVVTDDSLRNFTDFYTDTLFSYWIVESAKLHAQNSSVPVYLYEFTYISSAFELELPAIGATHGAQSDIIHDGLIHTHENMSENDIIVQTRTVDMWANFITFGEPVSTSAPEYWEPLDPENMNFLVININIENSTFPMQERLEFWDQIWMDAPGSASNTCIHISFLVFILSFTLLLR